MLFWQGLNTIVRVLRNSVFIAVFVFLLGPFLSYRVAFASYKANPDCLSNLTFTPPNWGADGVKWCTQNRAAYISMIIYGSNVGYIAAFAFLGLLRLSVEVAQENSSLCSYDAHPLPLTDGQIKTFLVQGGNVAPTTLDVVEKYSQVCFKYYDQIAWLGDGECTDIKGITFCAAYPVWAEDTKDFICVDIASTCPCVGQVGAGTLSDPEYVKVNGVISTDERGNASIVNKDDYMKYFVRHCTMLPSLNPMPIMSFEYQGVIDETCNGWKGYSKADPSFSAGPVQCISGTMRNIIEKPLLTPFTTNSIELTPELQLGLNALEYDSALVLQVMDRAQALVANIEKDGPLVDNTNFYSFKDDVDKMRNASAFRYAHKDQYKADMVLKQFIIVSNSSDSVNLVLINNARSNLSLLHKRIVSLTNDFADDARKNAVDENRLTMFQSLQGQVKILGAMIIIFYIVRIGLKVIIGSENLTLTVMLGHTMKVAIVYYFGLGDAWKEYFYGMIFNASFGVSGILFGAMADATMNGSDCDYSRTYYVVNEGDKCVNQNIALGGSKDAFVVGQDRASGKDIWGCMKGPFIMQINSQRLYNPTIYQETQAFGTTVTKYIKVYCVDNENSLHTIPATEQFNSVTGELRRLTCDPGYTMEDGYRVEELKKLGINVDKLTNGIGLTDVLPTALFRLDENGIPYDLYPQAGSTITSLQNKIARIKNTQAIEVARVNENQEHRNYPSIVKYGVVRDMSFIQVLDRMDCQFKNYLMYSSTEGFRMPFNVLSMLMGGIVAVILLIALLWYGIKIFSMMAHFVQSCLVASIGSLIIVYFSPITMALSLIDIPKGIGKDQIDRLTGFFMYLAMMSLAIGIQYPILDYAFYGAPETFISHKMFDSSGQIDGVNCWANDVWNAPIGCLLHKLSGNKKSITFLLVSFDIIAELMVMIALLYRILMFGLLMKALNGITQQFVSSMKQIFGIKVDMSLTGSIFNDPTGSALQDKMSAMLAKGLSMAAKGKGGGKGGGGGGAGGSAAGAGGGKGGGGAAPGPASASGGDKSGKGGEGDESVSRALLGSASGGLPKESKAPPMPKGDPGGDPSSDPDGEDGEKTESRR